MSDKQLTVAELMARAAQEGRSPRESSRPRRRRSLDEGGVSVAELTGSIPRVNKKPAEAKHSSVPLDSPEEEVAATFGVAVKDSEGPAHSINEPDNGVADAGDAVAEDAADTAEAGAVAVETSEASGAEDTDTADEVAEDIEAAQQSSAQGASAADADDEAVEEDIADDDDDDDGMVLSVVTEDDPVRLTTGSFPALSPELVDETPKADSLTANEGSEGEDEETVTKLVFAGDAETVEDDPNAEYQDQDFGDDTIAQRDSDADDDEDSATAYATGTFASVRSGQFERPATGTFAAQVDTDDEEEDDDVEDVAAVATSSEVEEYDDYDEDLDDEFDEEDYEEEESSSSGSVLSVIVMVIIAIAVGVGLFKGFEMLWTNLSKIITAALAVAVTGAIVGVVHALRTERDGLSMVLAGAAGLAVTFGPLLIVGL